MVPKKKSKINESLLLCECESQKTGHMELFNLSSLEKKIFNMSNEKQSPFERI